MSYIAAGGTVVGFPFIGPTSGTASSTPAWVPVASGVNATLFTDFTTEGTTNHYWFNNTAYGSFALWLAAIGGTFTRGATTNGAWYTNSSGLLASAGTNVLRFNYNPTGSTNIGILLEPAATNLSLWSRDLTQSGTWIATTMTTALTSTGADGVANSATRLTASALLATILQTPGLASASRTYSVYIRRVTGTGTIKLTVDGSTFSSDISGSLNSSTYTRIADQQTTVPIFGIQIGTSGDAIDVDFSQLEAGAATVAPTSPILTTNATITRAADSLNWPIPFVSFSTTVGSVITKYNSPLGGAVSPNPFDFSDGTASNRIRTSMTLTNGVQALRISDSGVDQANITVGNTVSTAYTNNMVGVGWQLNNFGAVANGGTAVDDVSGTIPVGLNIARLGALETGGVVIENISSFAYWGSRIADADLVMLTT